MISRPSRDRGRLKKEAEHEEEICVEEASQRSFDDRAGDRACTSLVHAGRKSSGIGCKFKRSHSDQQYGGTLSGTDQGYEQIYGSPIIVDGGSVVINGGVIELECADDCINTASNLLVNGGYVYAGSSGNDAIDSNADIAINGGVIYAFTLSSPEEAIDVNSGYTIAINGGYVFGIGNSQSGREGTLSGSQGRYQGQWSLGTSETYLKAAGTDIVGKIPAAQSSASGYLFCSVPGMTDSSAPSSTSAPSSGDTGFHGLYIPLSSATETYSASYTTADSLWFNTEAALSATSASLVFSPDGGTTWKSVDMSVNGEWASSTGRWWHVEIPAADLQAGTFEYCICIRDASGNEVWDNNSGSNYSLTITANN